MGDIEAAWSSSDDDDGVHSGSGRPRYDDDRVEGQRLRHSLGRFVTDILDAQRAAVGTRSDADPDRKHRGAADQLKSTATNRQHSVDPAAELLLSLADDDELVRARHEAIRQLRSELLVPSEVAGRARALLTGAQRDAAEVVNSMNTTVAEQQNDAASALRILQASAESIEQLRVGFQEIDSMIGTMQSVESYQRLRELHYLRHNNMAVLQWCRVFMNLSEPADYEDAIEAGEALVDVYEDIIVMQKVRTALAAVSSRYRAQISAMRATFDITDELVPKYTDRILGVLQSTCRTVLFEHLHEDDADDDGDVAAAMAQRTRVLLEDALKVIEKENGHEGDLLKYQGGTGSNPYDAACTSMQSPLHTDEIEDVVADGTAEVFHATLMVDHNGNVATSVDALVNAIDRVKDLLPLAEEGLLPLRSSVDLTRCVITSFHRCVMDGVAQCVEDAEQATGRVTAQDLLQLLRAIDEYREACVDYGGIVSQYADVSDVTSEQRRLLDAAVAGLEEYMVTMCENCSITAINETIRKCEMPNPDLPNAALDAMAVIDGNIRSLVSGASYAVLHKLAVATATAIQAFVEDLLGRLDWTTWHAAVEEYHAQWKAHQEQKAEAADAHGGEEGDGGASAPPPPKKRGGFFSRRKKSSTKPDEAMDSKKLIVEDGTPLEAGTPAVSEAWLAWQCTAVNGIHDMAANIKKIERYFNSMMDADEVELTLAGALPEDHVPDDDNPARWESPVAKVTGDFEAVCDVFIDRIVQYVCDVEMQTGWELMFVSPDWQANPSPKPPLDEIFVAARNAVVDLAPVLRDVWASRFNVRLVWHVALLYLEALARFIQGGAKKWLFAKNVDRDIDTLFVFWDTVLEHQPEAFAMAKRVGTSMQLILRIMTITDTDGLARFLGSEFVPEFADADTDYFPTLLIGARMDLDKKTREKMLKAFQQAWQDRPVARPGAPPSIVASIDAAGIREGGKRGWFFRGAAKADKTPGHRKQHARTASQGNVINLESTTPPSASKGRRRRTAAAADRKKKPAAEHSTISLAELLAKNADGAAQA